MLTSVSTQNAAISGPSRASAITIAAVTAIVASAPLAALCGLLYRFPIPFAGPMSGWDALPAMPLAIFFYGVMLGGFLALAALAALLATCIRAWSSHRGDTSDSFSKSVVAGLASAAIVVALLANWDLIYGPW